MASQQAACFAAEFLSLHNVQQVPCLHCVADICLGIMLLWLAAFGQDVSGRV
jgi:hypothetical protein